MNRMKITAALVAATLILAGCDETTGSSAMSGTSSGSTASSASINNLASKGNLSPDAIRLQTMSVKLVSLEQEQTAARDRVASFRTQGAGLGALAGAGAGFLACQLQDCSSGQRNTAVIAGAVGGGVIGHQAGDAQARRQNAAASAENEILRRLKVADQQLTTARQARAQAARVAAEHQHKLSQTQADVAAGRASKETLEMARADAAIDAQQIRQATTAMNSGKDSMKDEARLNGNQNDLTKEQQATQRSYDALMVSIKNSAL